MANEKTREFLKNHLIELHAFIVPVLTVIPRVQDGAGPSARSPSGLR